MQIKIFKPLPEFLRHRLVPFDSDYNGKSWADMYEAINFLTQNHPETTFDSVPYLYLDLAEMTHGYIFIEKATDKPYYVYR